MTGAAPGEAGGHPLSATRSGPSPGPPTEDGCGMPEFTPAARDVTMAARFPKEPPMISNRALVSSLSVMSFLLLAGCGDQAAQQSPPPQQTAPAARSRRRPSCRQATRRSARGPVLPTRFRSPARRRAAPSWPGRCPRAGCRRRPRRRCASAVRRARGSGRGRVRGLLLRAGSGRRRHVERVALGGHVQPARRTLLPGPDEDRRG